MDRIDLDTATLERPTRFLTFETTGTDVGHIVEMAFVKVMPDGQWHVRPDKEQGQGRLLISPQMPIPAESSAVHGISDSDVFDDAPTFESLAAKLYRWLDGCDLAGFNSNRFDVPLLEEFLRCNIAFKVDDRHLVDVQNIFHK